MKMMSSDDVRGVTFSHTHLILPSMSSRVWGAEDTFLLEHVAGVLVATGAAWALTLNPTPQTGIQKLSRSV